MGHSSSRSHKEVNSAKRRHIFLVENRVGDADDDNNATDGAHHSKGAANDSAGSVARRHPRAANFEWRSCFSRRDETALSIFALAPESSAVKDDVDAGRISTPEETKDSNGNEVSGRFRISVGGDDDDDDDDDDDGDDENDDEHFAFDSRSFDDQIAGNSETFSDQLEQEDSPKRLDRLERWSSMERLEGLDSKERSNGLERGGSIERLEPLAGCDLPGAVPRRSEERSPQVDEQLRRRRRSTKEKAISADDVLDASTAPTAATATATAAAPRPKRSVVDDSQCFLRTRSTTELEVRRRSKIKDDDEDSVSSSRSSTPSLRPRPRRASRFGHDPSASTEAVVGATKQAASSFSDVIGPSSCSSASSRSSATKEIEPRDLPPTDPPSFCVPKPEDIHEGYVDDSDSAADADAASRDYPPFAQFRPSAADIAAADPPPRLPPFVLAAMLDAEENAACDPVLLPRVPVGAARNHAYFQSVDADVVAISSTRRHRDKDVTTILYKRMTDNPFG